MKAQEIKLPNPAQPEIFLSQLGVLAKKKV